MLHGSRIDPPNRFERVRREPESEHLEWDKEYQRALEEREVEYLSDSSMRIISENDSPDIPFRHSLDPYRGCAHACPYCHARPTHEYLGFNAGLDCETKIVGKQEAHKLFRDFFDFDFRHVALITGGPPRTGSSCASRPRQCR